MPMDRRFNELNVWQNSMELAMRVFEHSKRFPPGTLLRKMCD